MTLRLKLTLGSIVVILLANTLLSLVNVAYLERRWLEEVQSRVRIDLNSAQASYAAHAESIARFLTAAALDPALAATNPRSASPELQRRMTELFRAGKMDLLVLLDTEGRTLFRPRNPALVGDDHAGNPLIMAAIRTGRPSSGTVLLSRERLSAEGEDLAAQAQFELLPTPAANPTSDRARSEGMVLGAAVPVIAQGKLLGVLMGGNVLNRRYSLVDQIRGQVFPAELYGDRQTGTVTVFQGDLRIATNVTSTDGSRATGTRMSSDVNEKVLRQGDTWFGPAFVVNDWYITAYEPIRDPEERIIGALYVGLLQAPFAHQRNVVMAVVLLATLLATAAGVLLLFFVAKLVLAPVERVVAMAHRVIEGDLSARIGSRPVGEMGVLCEAVDRMADALAQREKDRNAVAQQQLGRSEKLASIGRLAAGVAHEINNPLTGVLTFAHLLRDKPKMDAEDKEDLELIIHETTRAAEIVRNLLDFARERAAIKERLCINDVIARTIRLIRNQKAFDQIRFDENFANDLPEIDGNLNQLQQVFLNLSLNSCEAMPKGGTITINSLCRDGRVVVEVIDSGCGIKKEHLDRIFEPFFTTKPVGKGTGLGLAVSYGIIDQHGGTLELETEEGKGTKFIISLPIATGRLV